MSSPFGPRHGAGRWFTAIHVAEDVCAAVPHRQVVLTIPKRLRMHTRFDRKLLGNLCAAAWAYLRVDVRCLLGRDDVVDQSVFLPVGDRAGIERLVGYMPRRPFSLARLVRVTETGQVIYKAEKQACRAFPDPQRDELARGPKRNFQVLDPLDFLRRRAAT